MSNVLYVQNLEKQIAGQKQLVAEQNRLNKERQEWALHTNEVIADLKQTIEHQAAQIEMLRDFIETAPVSTGVCCCGESMEGHSSPMSCGHTPVDLWDHSVISVLSATPDQALERFAAKVREQCAQVCFDRAKRPNDGYWTDAGWATVCSANELAGEAILEIKEIPK